jgi:hypothetical protein
MGLPQTLPSGQQCVDDYGKSRSVPTRTSFDLANFSDVG